MTSDSPFPTKQIRFALGEGYNLGKAKNKTESLTKFVSRFERPTVTPEKRHEFLKFADAKQAHLKASGGWFMRSHVEKGKRTRDSIKPGDLITLDADYATPEWQEALLAGEFLPGICLFAHTTRSHTPEHPRFRIVIPLVLEVTSEEYQAACRIVAQMGAPDLTVMDKVSARVAQMMYMPTVSKDMEKYYVCYKQEGELLNHRQAIKAWEKINGPSTDISKLPRFAGEGELREAAEKAEDPLEKDGIVGTFCRAYSITELVEGKENEDPILSEVYEITEWEQGAATRMTYMKGSTSNGAVVYDDKFVYSHHGSDPAQDKLVNAYDLVRIHLFNAKDDDEDAPMNKKKSVKEIDKWARDLKGYRTQRVSEQYDLDEMFDDADDMSWAEDATKEDFFNELIGDYDTLAAEARQAKEDEEHAEAEDLLGAPIERDTRDRYERRKAKKPPKDWVASQLELKADGSISPTLTNVATILTNDPRFFQKIAYNEFSQQVVLTADIKSKSKTIPDVICTDKRRGMPWSDLYDITIRAVIEGENGRRKPGYGFAVQDRNIVGGVTLAGRNNSFHPIKEYLEDLHGTWDQTDRIGTFLHDYVGAEQSDYTAEAFRKMLLASIARVDRPGCKFDYAIILEGKQGIGKSTLIKIIYGEDYFGEIDADLQNRREIAEQIAGKWCLELPELSSLHKADHNAAKAFMRRQDDDVRMAYGRSVTRLPRQCVFWGTTNDTKYLRDPTGNRTWWPVKCEASMIDFAAVMRVRNQIWAQAYDEYQVLADRYPTGDLPLNLSQKTAQAAQQLQERARSKELWEEWLQAVIDWFEAPVRLLAVAEELDIDFNLDEEDQLVQRVGFNQQTVLIKALEFHDGVLRNPTHMTAWSKVKAGLKERGFVFKSAGSKLGGKKGRWIISSEATEEDQWRGYIFSDEAEPHRSPLSETDEGDSLI